MADGLRIESGVDSDGDGELSDEEVTVVSYFCPNDESEAGANEVVSLSGANVESQ